MSRTNITVCCYSIEKCYAVNSMIEKAAQTEIVLHFEDGGWIDMHKRDGDECVHAAAAPHNAPCEQEVLAESVNEDGGR